MEEIAYVGIVLIRCFYIKGTWKQVINKNCFQTNRPVASMLLILREKFSPGSKGSGDQLREKFWPGPVIRPGGSVGSAPIRRAGDPGSNPSPEENSSLKINKRQCI